MWKLVLLLIIGTGSLVSCSGKEDSAPALALIEHSYSRMEIDSDIHDAHNRVFTVDDPDKVKEIISRITTSTRSNAAEVALEQGPAGLLTFSDPDSGAQTIEIPYFPESGDVLYKDYFIDSELTPLLVE